MPTSSSSIHLSSHCTRKPKAAISHPQESAATANNNKTMKATSNGFVAKKENVVRYRECRKNHAASLGGYVVDGCREFMAAGEEGTSAALLCDVCSCHRSFHKREVEVEIETVVVCDCSSNSNSDSNSNSNSNSSGRKS